MAGTLVLNLARYTLLLKNLNSAYEIIYIYNVSRCRQLMWTRMTTLWFSTVALLSGTGSRLTQRIDSLHEKRNLFRWSLVLTVSFECHLSDRLTQS